MKDKQLRDYLGIEVYDGFGYNGLKMTAGGYFIDIFDRLNKLQQENRELREYLKIEYVRQSPNPYLAKAKKKKSSKTNGFGPGGGGGETYYGNSAVYAPR